MIPSILATHVRRGIEDFITTTFPTSTPFFHGLTERMMKEDGGVFKGPYLSLQLPFRQGAGGPDFFPDVPMNNRPYLHQETSFKRLSGPSPRSTLIATGTGSGKTECFLYPILDHCYRFREQKGIKALIIYPMNALASDQAGRIAKAIWNNPKLRGSVSAGLYIGGSEGESRLVMDAGGVITNKDTLRLQPPDILLTNYKMLDYLLVRPKDLSLWKQNDPETLRYLVVDELHTFDGAQGTDLACLIRRLKSRLRTPGEHLCCIGTSATLGGGDAEKDLRDYAGRIFAEPFDESCIIYEERITPGEFLDQSVISHVDIIPPEKIEQLLPESYDGYKSFVKASYEMWLGKSLAAADFPGNDWRVELGEWLKEHLFFQNLLRCSGGKIISIRELISRLEKVTPELKNAECSYSQALLDNILTLISEARIWAPENLEERALREKNGKPRPALPFLHVRIQLWLRELRRMVSDIRKTPSLRFANDLKDEQLKRHLPVVHCRECGATGWSGLKKMNETYVTSNLQGFYLNYFSHDPKVIFLFPEQEETSLIEEDGAYCHFCGMCLHLTAKTGAKKCPSCGHDELIRVFIPNSRASRKDRIIGLHDCPWCGGKESLTLIGSQAASLISVLIVQLYSSTFNDDKKLLTFSDSVQDAAHRASFFEARSYRFNFRTALQKLVLESGEGLTLPELASAFVRYWRNRLGENAYIAAFCAPNMAWLADYEHLKSHGAVPAGSDLGNMVDQRAGWEIFSEYGFNSLVGRTLEKSGSSVAYVDPGLIDSIIPVLTETLQNEINELRSLDEGHLRTFLAGLLASLKHRGGIHHPVLNHYIEQSGNTFLFRKIPWMPGFGGQSRAPIFLTTKHDIRFDPLLSRSQKQYTWYQAWAVRCFMHINPLSGERAADIYQYTLKCLEDAGVLERRAILNDFVWGILPDALRVTSSVRRYRCRKCGHMISSASHEQSCWNGAPCLRFKCEGIYVEEPASTRDYYRILYSTGDVERIVAEEHTGLLEREVREALEKRFKADDRAPWDPNVLSCTPTLEMGIDIGDLSSLIMCSVPPGQANYLQRIGRAGRRDGNSLNLTVANARPHDLYFFAEPEKMISGNVDSPGVFLEASAVLERQFTAFCFDRWVETGITATMLPSQIRNVLGSLSVKDVQKFPHNFLHFIETSQAELLQHFTEMFPGLSAESAAHLRTFVYGDRKEQGSLAWRIMEGLHSLHAERESLRKKIHTIGDRIKQKEQSSVKDRNYEQEVLELKRERHALQAIISTISEKDTLNFFTDEGLLPNYAFPESGVVLRSVIYRKREKHNANEPPYETRVYQYERPAVSAIVELAPSNRFYALGRRVMVDQVDMTVSEVETWRFCNSCSYMELMIQTEHTHYCPRCGSTLWADNGQFRKMIRMRQVFATTSDRDSRIGDDLEEREPSFYNTQVLVDFDSTAVKDAYKVASDEFPFGFEFIDRIALREVNFGEKGEFGEKVTIAGSEIPRRGFVLCSNCGKVQQKKDEIIHAHTCTARDKSSAKNLTECVYLYREFVSEAIRILLPVTTFSGSDEKLHSFVAALQLGLKRHFQGTIDHLETTVYEEPVPNSAYRKKYLMLYDKVPGGTGYLKQLMRSQEPLFEVLEKALEALRSCECNLERENDGCYRCLYAYRTSYDMEETSRDTAIELISEMTKYKNKLEHTDSLRNVPVNALFDSELEARFIDALRHSHTETTPVSLSKTLINAKPGYFLKIGDYNYFIEPQVMLGADEGVTVPAKADFLLRPAREADGLKPIAVFTDGYLYHRDRIGKDLAQRRAIVRSGNYHVWSLTWKDVENHFHPQMSFFTDLTALDKAPNRQGYSTLVEKYELGRLKNVHHLDSFEMLILFLSCPDSSKWTLHAFLHGMMNLDKVKYDSSDEVTKWLKSLKENLPPVYADPVAQAGDSMLYGLLSFEDSIGAPSCLIFLGADQTAIAGSMKKDLFLQSMDGMRIAAYLDDSTAKRDDHGFESLWNGYLRAYNIFQFLRFSFFTSNSNMAGSDHEVRITEKVTDGRKAGIDKVCNEWTEICDITDISLHPLLHEIEQRKIPVPAAGYELCDEKGAVIGSAELAWEDIRIALLRTDEKEYANRFTDLGWKVFLLDEVLSDSSEFFDYMKTKLT